MDRINIGVTRKEAVGDGHGEEHWITDTVTDDKYYDDHAALLGSGLELVGESNDAVVSGADHLDARPGFAELLAYIASNGARTVIVETARFARDLMVQEVGFAKLKALGIATGHTAAASI